MPPKGLDFPLTHQSGYWVATSSLTIKSHMECLCHLNLSILALGHPSMTIGVPITASKQQIPSKLLWWWQYKIQSFWGYLSLSWGCNGSCNIHRWLIYIDKIHMTKTINVWFYEGRASFYPISWICTKENCHFGDICHCFGNAMGAPIVIDKWCN